MEKTYGNQSICGICAGKIIVGKLSGNYVEKICGKMRICAGKIIGENSGPSSENLLGKAAEIYDNYGGNRSICAEKSSREN